MVKMVVNGAEQGSIETARNWRELLLLHENVPESLREVE
jgi:hypothetical protein